jgi:hypothetical protein
MFLANRRNLVKGVVKIRIWEHLLGMVGRKGIVVREHDAKTTIIYKF